jgi:hypothetical protein
VKWFKHIALICLVVILSSCENKESLQQYYVANQDNKQFVALDLPVSYFIKEDSLNTTQKNSLKTIRKINLLALPKSEVDKEAFEKEKVKISNLFTDKQYHLLMKFEDGDGHLEIYYTGQEDSVEEIVAYGYNDKKGLGLARLLGDEMHPNDIAALIKVARAGNFNSDKFDSIQKIFQK